MGKPRLKDDKEQIKKRLFEVMEKIAWLPPINENYEELDTNVITGDVRNLGKLASPAQQKAAKRINSQREFNEAFEMWFGSLGFDDPSKKGKIKIATTITHITEVLKKNGINF